MAVIQLDLFEEPPTELDMMREDIKDINTSVGKVRRGLFARHGDLAKLYLELEKKTLEMDNKLDRILEILNV